MILKNNGIIYFIGRKARLLYGKNGSEILRAYLTPFGEREYWKKLSPIERERISASRKLDLEGRSLAQLAKVFGGIRNASVGKPLITRILDIAVEEGVLTREERDAELSYRRSVNAVYGKNRIKARGQKPYSLEELEIIMRLAGDSRYQHERGAHKGRPNWSRVAFEIKKKFGTDRTPDNLKKKFYEKLRK